MESLGYMLLYFLNGSLPWLYLDGMAKGEEAANTKIMWEMKKNDQH
jgi:hypothetical protein